MRRIKRFEELDFSETRYKEVQNIVKDILIDLDEFPSIEWKLGDLKHSRYFPNSFKIADVYNCIADLNIISLTKLMNHENGWKSIMERLISQLNNEGFTVFEYTNKNSNMQILKMAFLDDYAISSVQNRITDNWLKESSGSYYKTFKICITNI